MHPPAVRLLITLAGVGGAEETLLFDVPRPGFLKKSNTMRNADAEQHRELDDDVFAMPHRHVGGRKTVEMAEERGGRRLALLGANPLHRASTGPGHARQPLEDRLCCTWARPSQHRTEEEPMTWVDIADDARRVPHVLASQSLDDALLRAHLGLCRTIMFGESALSRAEREAIAASVSVANACHR